MAEGEDVTSANAALRIAASATPSTSPVRAAHAEFVLAMAGHEPRPISIDADVSDLEDGAEHQTKVFTILDTAQNVSGRLDLAHIGAVLSDLASDVAGTIKQAADDMAERLS